MLIFFIILILKKGIIKKKGQIKLNFGSTKQNSRRVNQVCPISNPYPEGRIYKKEGREKGSNAGLWRKDYYDK